MLNFWQTNPKPILALAPMDDVTDTVFREIILSVSNPGLLSVVFTEFTSTDGLCHPIGSLKVIDRLKVSASENTLIKNNQTKLVAQLWGSDPEKFYRSAKIVAELGCFHGVDINMGCPVKKVVNHKSCSALINDPQRALEIIQATKEGSQMPVSVKTRLGFKTVITEEWIGQVLKANPDAITIHGRTQKMMSTGLVLWDEIAKAVQLRNNTQSSTALIGNGDVLSYSEALSHIERIGLDGIMIGRGIFKNPWLFNTQLSNISIEKRFELLMRHVELFELTWGNRKSYNILKRFFKIYLSEFNGASECRERIMKTNCYKEAYDMLKQLKKEIIAISPYELSFV